MSAEKTAYGAPAGPAGGAVRRTGLAKALAVVVALECLSIVVQAITAGSFLNGNDSMKDVHAKGAAAVIVLALIQLVLSVVHWRKRGPGWLALASTALLVLVVAQAAVGGSHNLAVHVPLGVITFGVAVALATWVWQPRRGA
ncbi:hypothetical protein [Kitasatospora viridis]|uniref:Integral membrane protein n=1 Tax=Kitasatospora viridis TaxID=281105 RepID=A0A561UCE2_9ACTN|nr:hypothetical protein [Kitasatospora viridis]TWF97027.1 hypothetical protein FHX73_11802 [Kitasatospora viridis]